MPRPVIDDAISRAASSVGVDAELGLEVRPRDVLGFVGGDGPHDLLRTEPVDHGQQAPRRDVDVGHRELTGVGAGANDVGDEVQPLVGQRVGLRGQRGVAPTEAPRVEPQRAGVLAGRRRAGSPSARRSCAVGVSAAADLRPRLVQIGRRPQSGTRR